MMLLKRISQIGVSIGLFLFPFFVHAQAVTLINPLGEGSNDPRLLIGRLIAAVLSIVGSLALLMFLYGGLIWITSMGESDKVMKGKKILIWATLGLVIVASAYVIVNAIILGLTTGSATGAATT
jgi:hypothetical protein